MIQIKRIYEPAVPEDGQRYLVDRLWPRGVSKDRARLVGWLKDLAPSPELRRWFNHEAGKFELFRSKYIDELTHDQEKRLLLERIATESREGTITLVYAARDPLVNHAIVLLIFLRTQYDV
ncbi:DUF488 domain-containing protein [Sporolactobacillus pectinivorans]|uniref:DUF488 domain-containing protein n=1 Tax=Sporolactobacillus pectinivorans TaxID=1591408 RepID=UPI0030B802A2